MTLASDIIDRAEMGVVEPALLRAYAGGIDRAADAAAAARARCLRHRRRILELSRNVAALHIGGAFSCCEVVDSLYHDVMRDGDTFLLSKGHAAIMQYAVLESRGVLPREWLDSYCAAGGKLGVHPELGTPGIAASTGSLGHGLGMAVGMAMAERLQRKCGKIYIVMSDGELQEGSTWEAIMLASSFRLGNIVGIVDNNNRQSSGRTSETHPSFYPLGEKLRTFGWAVREIDGHDHAAIVEASATRLVNKPTMIIARTVKGKGVSFMEDVPIWHYRSPNEAEYHKAMRELA